MAITVKHSKVSTIPDDADTSLVRPSDWNADHTLVGTVPVANGGTGTATLTGYVIGNGTSAMTASATIPSGDVSGLGTMATQNANAIAVTGGTINGTTIGATTASNGAFTYLSTSSTTSTTPVLSYDASNCNFAIGATIAGSYLQTVMQNKSATANASTNWAVSNNLGTDSSYYGEFGMNSSVYSSGTPADFFSINNGVYFSGHDGDLSIGSGNGFKTYLAWGTTGDKAHVINASGAIGLNTNITGTSNFGTSGQVLTSGGSSATPTWTTASTGTVTSVATAGTVNGLTLTGGPITSTGTVTLGGTLDLSSPPAIGGTTPAAGTFTTITGQTATLNGTGQNLLLQSNSFSSSSWATYNNTFTSGQSDPFGGSTAFLVTETAAGDFYQGFTVTNGNAYTLSGYFKAGTASSIQLQCYFTSQIFTIICNLSAGTFTTTGTGTGNVVSVGNGWYRFSAAATATATGTGYWQVTWSSTSGTFYVYGAQANTGSSAGTYTPTTTTQATGFPTLNLAGGGQIALDTQGNLSVSPAGTGALQAQATTSSTVGGNARGANAVDWQTTRGTAAQVASAINSVIGGGYGNFNSGFGAVIAGGYGNTANNNYAFIGGGNSNNANGQYSTSVGGQSNTSAGFYNFIGGGFTNSGTANAAVTTQSGTMNATTAVTLSGSNASIKVGQYITGTSIASNTYVAAISGTSLTLSVAASGSSTSTLSFYTPHGIVVGGGNNQATGAYSFIGGGGDAGTAANRNVASGDWSFVGGGKKNTAGGVGSVVCGGGTDGTSTFSNTANGTAAFIGSGWNHTAAGIYSVIVGGSTNSASGGRSFVGAGDSNNANSDYSFVAGGTQGTARSIVGNHVFPACNQPIAGSAGVSQSALLVLGAQTTDATATVLRSNTSAASGTNQVILPNNSAYYFKGSVIAGVTGAGDTKGWSIEGAIKRGAGVGTAVLVGTPTVSSLYADTGAATWTVTALADTTNGGLKITVTGQASTTIRWVAKIETTEMTY